MKKRRKYKRSLWVKLLKLKWLYLINKEATSIKGIKNYIREYLTYEQELSYGKDYGAHEIVNNLRNKYQFKSQVYEKMKHSSIKYSYYLLFSPIVLVITIILYKFFNNYFLSFSVILMLYVLFLFKNLLFTIFYSTEKNTIYYEAYKFLDQISKNEKEMKVYYSTISLKQLNEEKIPLKKITQSLCAELVALPFILDIIDKPLLGKGKKLEQRRIGNFVNDHFYLEDGSKLDDLGSLISSHINQPNDNTKSKLIQMIFEKIETKKNQELTIEKLKKL